MGKILGKKDRRFKRVYPHPKRPIEVQIMGTGFMDLVHARNISEGGMKIVVPHLFEGCDIDSVLEIIVTLPTTKSFLVKAKIRHIASGAAEGSFGVQFLNLKPDHSEQVKDYVDMRLRAGAEYHSENPENPS